MGAQGDNTNNNNCSAGLLPNGQQHPALPEQKEQEEGSHSHDEPETDEAMDEVEEEEDDNDTKENEAEKHFGDGDGDGEEEEEGDDAARMRSINHAGTLASSTPPNKNRTTPQPKKASLNALSFPFTRVKRLIKSDPDTRVSSEAAYVITKAVDLFLEKFVEQPFEYMVDDRRHYLTYKDLATHVSRTKRLHFLADFVPEKVTAALALEEVKEE